MLERHGINSMGLWKWIKTQGRKNKGAEDFPEEPYLQGDQTEPETEWEPAGELSHSSQDQAELIKNSCEQMAEADRQIDEAKVEYQAVTAYLTDMQKIERTEGEEREVIDDAARRIITLTRERIKYQGRGIKITDAQFRSIEKYESDIIKVIKKMEQNEKFAAAIESDMGHLEKERKRLGRKKKEIINRQKYLKGLSLTTFTLVGILFLLFLALGYVFQTDMQIPFLMTIVMAAASALYIFLEAGKNRYDMKLTEKKLNRAIGLLNKVKIKYVNNTNVLDYSYEKYGVKNSSELGNLWQQYLKAKAAAERYKHNTEMLNHYNEVLIGELKKLGVFDPDIWVYQAIAIIDQKEMVEVRHRLNVRRQKLRERIDYNYKLKVSAVELLEKLISENPALGEEVKRVSREYNIT